MVSKLDLVDGYHKVTATYLDNAAQVARASFLNLGSWRENDIERYINEVIPTLNNAKRNMATYTTTFYSQIAQLSGEKFVTPDILNNELTTSALRNGVSENAVWSRPFKSMWTSLSKGEDMTAALDEGARRAVDLARTEVQLARRKAGLVARNANDRIVGYLRTLSGSESCALCYVASTQRYRKADLLPIHPACDCGEIPIYGQDDPGQIIDEIRLDATHQAVEERFGISDRGARAIDYRALKIQDNGELGPVLTVRGEKFTKLTRAEASAPIKTPTPVAPAVVKTFATKIQSKLKTISAKTVVDDIVDEHGSVRVSNLRGAKKIQTLGPKTQQHLDDIKAVGSQVDREIGNRVKLEIDRLADSAQIAATQKQIKLTETLRENAKQAYEATLQKEIGRQLAELDEDIQRRYKSLQQTSSNPAYPDEWLAEFTDAFRLKRATSDAELILRNSQAGRSLLKKIDDLTDDLKTITDTLPANVVPGTARYNQIYAAKAQEVLAEVRELGDGGPFFTGGSQQVLDLLEDAKKVYPSSWLEAAGTKYNRINTLLTSRGAWAEQSQTIKISSNPSNGFKAGYRTAVHELGHVFEDSVPGIKEIEFAYAHQRAALNPKRANFSSTEKGFQDAWRSTYSGRDYGYEVDSNYEIFTTGVESIFGGGDKFLQTTKNSIYRNPSLPDNVGIDEEFRQFILGVLFSL